MMKNTSSRKTSRPKGYIVNCQPQAETRVFLSSTAKLFNHELLTRQIAYALPAPRGDN